MSSISPAMPLASKARRAVALDLDGILLDGMQFHIAAWRAAFAHIDLSLSDRELYLLEGIKTRDVVDIICADYCLDLTTAERDDIAKRKKQVYREVFQVATLDGAAELLTAIFNAGYEVAIVTGTLAESATSTLTRLGFGERVSVIVSADLEIPGKPDPAPFLKAIELLRVEKAHCLAVDNAPAGITSAKRAGLICAGVATYLESDDLNQADAVFDDVRDLSRWIEADHSASGVGAWSLATSRSL